MKRTGLLVMAAGLALVAGCSDPGLGVVHLYDPAPVPFVPDRTTEVAATGTLADGFYWATVADSDPAAADPATITFTLVRAEFDTDGAVAITDEPAREVEVDATTLKFASVAALTRKNYAVTPEELAGLVAGITPSSPAPTDYAYQPYPFLLTVEGGVVSEAYQIWLDDAA